MASRESRRAPHRVSAVELVALLMAFVLVAMVAGVIASGFVLPLAAGANTVSNQAVSLFDEVPDQLTADATLSEASFIYASDGTKLATFYSQNRIVDTLSEISQPMKDAIVAIEDHGFYEHGAVDLHSMVRAFINNKQGNAQQGASTLTQQYVKNVLVNAASTSGDIFGIIDAQSDSYSRKLKEMKVAIALEEKMTKDQILEGYLNIAQFGIKRIYGVEAAARYYFNKPASDLTIVEAATIAGITKAPSLYDPSDDKNLPMATNRRDLVIKAMWTYGYISTAERDDALATDLKSSLTITPVPVGCETATGAEFFCDYVRNEILNSPEFGATPTERQDLLDRGGLSIVTTLDTAKQAEAQAAVNAHVPDDPAPDKNPDGLDTCVVSVAPGTGQILAMAQNVPYSADAEHNPGTTAINYCAGHLLGASVGFQPGSSFKPIALTEWLLEGYHLLDEVNAPRTPRPMKLFHASCGGSLAGGPDWPVTNSETNSASRMSVLKATYESVNTAYATMAQTLDLCGVRNTAWMLGFRPTATEGPNGQLIPFDDPTKEDIQILPGMVLGQQVTAPLYMANTYATFASGGTHCDPIAITSVTKSDGTALPVPSANCEEVINPSIADTVTYALQKVLTEPGATARGDGLTDRPSAGKTGTTDAATQTWFVGYTPQLSTAVWVGNATSTVPHLNVTLNGKKYRPMYGADVAAPLWKDYMDQALAGVEAVPFNPPNQSMVGKPPLPTCTITDPTDPAFDPSFQCTPPAADGQPPAWVFLGPSASTKATASPGAKPSAGSGN
jgi:membrane peptidoglycan carboxypeptidase